MTSFLLDANVLIALTVTNHVDHHRAAAWASAAEQLAVCPLVEGALFRFLVRSGQRPSVVQELIREVRRVRNCDFWVDSVSYADVDVAHVRGYRQLTDAYLASLANSRGALVATLDRGLASAAPRSVRLLPEL